jgi:hypothetical protein
MKKNKVFWLLSSNGLLKMIKIMRFAIFILFLSISQSFAFNSYSQQTKVSLEMINVKVEAVIDKLEQKTDFFFLYNKNLIDVDRIVSIKAQNEKIDEVLDKLFHDTGISYQIKDRQILLINNKLELTDDETSEQKTVSVSGRVTDSSGAPVPGVTVLIKGTTLGTVTNANGMYNLSKVPDDAILQYSFVGMKTQEINVRNKTSINVVLSEETIGLNEVVAVG